MDATIWTAVITAVAGVFLYGLGQGFYRLCIEPLVSFRNQRARARHLTLYHCAADLRFPEAASKLQNALAADKSALHDWTAEQLQALAASELTRRTQARDELFGLASDLATSAETVKPYWALRLFCGAPRHKSDLRDGALHLAMASIALTNEPEEFGKYMAEAVRFLGFETGCPAQNDDRTEKA